MQKPVIGDIDPSLLHTSSYIDGAFTSVQSSASFDVQDPATQSSLATVTSISPQQLERAIISASDAQKTWKKKPIHERCDLIANIADLIEKHEQDLALLITKEEGKPLFESMGELAYAKSFFRFYAEEGKRLMSQVQEGPAGDNELHTTYEPVGLGAAITPWNFPQAMVARKMAPALVSGCSLLIKPAEDAPLSALALAELSRRAGIPAGVVQVAVCSSSEISSLGHILTSSPYIQKISFTGSTKVGKLLLSQSANTLKRVSLELGGNAPFIVFDDANISEAVEGAMAAKFRNSGQTCIAAQRFFIHSKVFEQFVTAMTDAMKTLNIGPGTKENVQIGPLVNQECFDKVKIHVEDAISKGSRVILGGYPSELGGYFYQPTLLTHVPANALVMKEETFGPVVVISSFDDEAEVIKMANHEEAGLVAYFYTESYSRIKRVSQSLEYGMIGINTGKISYAAAAFGGTKHSGLGREGGKIGLLSWMEPKYLCINQKTDN